MKTLLPLLALLTASTTLADVAPIQLETPPVKATPSPPPTPAATTTPAAAATTPAASASATPDAGRISASVIHVIANGSSSVIYLNRGVQHDVKVGAKGRIEGIDAELVITEVFPARSKATIAAPAAAVEKKNASIEKNPAPAQK